MVKSHAVVKYYNVVEYYVLLTKICYIGHSRDYSDDINFNECPIQEDQSIKPDECRMNMESLLEI